MAKHWDWDPSMDQVELDLGLFPEDHLLDWNGTHQDPSTGQAIDATNPLSNNEGPDFAPLLSGADLTTSGGNGPVFDPLFNLNGDMPSLEEMPMDQYVIRPLLNCL